MHNTAKVLFCKESGSTVNQQNFTATSYRTDVTFSNEQHLLRCWKTEMTKHNLLGIRQFRRRSLETNRYNCTERIHQDRSLAVADSVPLHSSMHQRNTNAQLTLVSVVHWHSARWAWNGYQPGLGSIPRPGRINCFRITGVQRKNLYENCIGLLRAYLNVIYAGCPTRLVAVSKQQVMQPKSYMWSHWLEITMAVYLAWNNITRATFRRVHKSVINDDENTRLDLVSEYNIIMM